MNHFFKNILVLILFMCAGILGGCNFFNDSFESADVLDKTGKNVQAIDAYQKYLKKHPLSSLMAQVEYRIAKKYEAQSDYANAIKSYEKIVSDYPKSDEALHALLDLASLYRDKVKNVSKALEYSQKAYVRFMDNIQVKGAVQLLIDSEYQTATAYFVDKNYKKSEDAANGIFQAYPGGFIVPDIYAKIQALADRAHRADAMTKASVDEVLLRNEIAFNKGYENDFPNFINSDDRIIPSPDGSYLVSRKKGPNGIYYLYLAKTPVKGDQVIFKLIGQTFGANLPSWSPNSHELVYLRNVRGRRELDRTDIKLSTTQSLFWTKTDSLGTHAAYHPAGNMIVYVYAGKVWLINSTGIDKRWLKTNQKLDYTANLTWSNDGTMIRYQQMDKHGKSVDEVLVLDVSNSPTP